MVPRHATTDFRIAILRPAWPAWLLFCGLLSLAPAAPPPPPPAAPRVAVLRTDWHDDYRPMDLHALVETVGAWGNIRLTRYADGAVNLPFPGASLRPFDDSVEWIRHRYYQWGLARFRPTRRIGDLCDALLLRELSVTDLLLGAQARRIQGMIDWGQLVIGDCGDLLGWPFGVTSKTTLKYPNRIIDYGQAGADRVVHEVGIFFGRIGDAALNHLEHLADPRRRVPLAPGAGGMRAEATPVK